MSIIHGIDKLKKKKNNFKKDLELKEASLQQLQSALKHELELEEILEFFSLQFGVSFCCWLHLLLSEIALLFAWFWLLLEMQNNFD